MPGVIKDELLDAQLMRAMSYAPYGGADVGECFAIGERINKADLDLWFSAWNEAAQKIRAAADESAKAGNRASARDGYLRASNYLRTAASMLIGAPVDDRFREAMHQQIETFRLGAQLFDLPPDILEIPYEGTTLPGYFFRASDDGKPRPTLILTDGYDGTVEELYFATGAEALRRGYNVLAFDGPGQGSVILDQGIVFRPDWENVVIPVVDFALTIPEIDAKKLVLVGWSFGGYLAPRAAASEHRLAACVSDCGPYDLWEAAQAKFPPPLIEQIKKGNRVGEVITEKLLDYVEKKPTAGWAIRRNLWVHGFDDMLDFLKVCNQYSLKGREADIACPTFVCNTDVDDLSSNAKEFFDKLTCEKEFVTFKAADGAGAHCEIGGRLQYHQRVFEWLERVLPN